MSALFVRFRPSAILRKIWSDLLDAATGLFVAECAPAFLVAKTGFHRIFSLMEHLRAAAPTVLSGIKRVILVVDFIN
jgi:hypothetical protein